MFIFLTNTAYPENIRPILPCLRHKNTGIPNLISRQHFRTFFEKKKNTPDYIHCDSIEVNALLHLPFFLFFFFKPFYNPGFILESIKIPGTLRMALASYYLPIFLYTISGSGNQEFLESSEDFYFDSIFFLLSIFCLL